jgi:hypothetical protein
LLAAGWGLGGLAWDSILASPTAINDDDAEKRADGMRRRMAETPYCSLDAPAYRLHGVPPLTLPTHDPGTLNERRS